MKTVQKRTQNRKKRIKRSLTATQKCHAVLALWSSNQSAIDICRELNVSYNQLDKWQRTAFDGMVEALKPKLKNDANSPTSLAPRLQRLLARIEEEPK